MEYEKENLIFSATEEATPVAFSDRAEKNRKDYSFTAKLILSQESVKEFYAQMANALLGYENVHSRTGWAGVTFYVGREKIAYITINGKTLCLYLAIDPADYVSGPYRAKDVSMVKRHKKTPCLLRIKNEGAQAYALSLIQATALQAGLEQKPIPGLAVTAANFMADSVDNLITRGLIRTSIKPATVALTQPLVDKKPDAYADTLESIDSLLERHGIYNEFLTHFAEGEGRARFSQKMMLRCVDEIWVKAVEDCISALDELIRNPNHFIAETEDVLPIERTKRISGRSIAHLGRHTDYLSLGENGEYTPTKMLNVFREDSLLTYENKFLNTLINRLFLFVNRRYKVAKEYGVDEKLESLEFENTFTHGDGKGKIKISIEYSQRDLNSDVKNVLIGSGLWSRVERLNDIVTGYVNSSFCKSMERNFVRPPIMRTNAILKNKYFRECLALWEFIESYDDAGYGILVDEKEQEMSEEYIKATYSGVAMQYLLFRHNLENGFSEESESVTVHPDFLLLEAKKEAYTEEFAYEKPLEEFRDDLDLALRVALLADEQTEDDDDRMTVMTKSFDAKLRLADDCLKQNFAQICNAFLQYGNVHLQHGTRYATLSYGEKTLAKIVISGGVMKMYTSLVRKEIPDDFRAIDIPGKKEFADTPTCFAIDSQRSIEIAKEIADMFAIKYELSLCGDGCETVDAGDFRAETLLDMMQRGWITFSRRQIVKKDHYSVSFGPARSAQTLLAAEDASRLAVAEPSKMAEEIAIAASAKEESVSEEAQRLADKISGLIRPTGNYDKPTEYGIDDSTAFMEDETDKHNGELE